MLYSLKDINKRISFYEGRMRDLHFLLLGLIGKSGKTTDANMILRSIQKAHCKINRWKQRKLNVEKELMSNFSAN